MTNSFLLIVTSTLSHSFLISVFTFAQDYIDTINFDFIMKNIIGIQLLILHYYKITN
jgi:hypothetical protein